VFCHMRPGLVRLRLRPDPGDHALADDLVQAAFMAAARQWPTMRCLHDAQRLRWLHTTVGKLPGAVHNLAKLLDHRRRTAAATTT
jgi:hypothetical protein